MSTALEEMLKIAGQPYRMSPPTRYIKQGQYPTWVLMLQDHGYDPDDVVAAYNESVRRNLEARP